MISDWLKDWPWLLFYSGIFVFLVVNICLLKKDFFYFEKLPGEARRRGILWEGILILATLMIVVGLVSVFW